MALESGRIRYLGAAALQFLLNCMAFGQYPGPAGQPGSTAISADDASFRNWAVGCTVVRGDQDISQPSLGKASAGDSTMACGKGGTNGSVSLGDGGRATCFFMQPIVNGPGFDFAVFENSFNDSFLELAFVEVSSDGQHFFRFPAHSESDTIKQTASFDSTDARKIHQLAGKYRGGYGTPFDLETLKYQSGLDVGHITHVRVIDVVGSINRSFATRDSSGRMINDPWPTPFPSGGFDLDAIGVIHQDESVTKIEEKDAPNNCDLFPNPVQHLKYLKFSCEEITQITVRDINGEVVFQGNDFNETGVLPAGIYAISITNGIHHRVKKVIIQ